MVIISFTGISSGVQPPLDDSKAKSDAVRLLLARLGGSSCRIVATSLSLDSRGIPTEAGSGLSDGGGSGTFAFGLGLLFSFDRLDNLLDLLIFELLYICKARGDVASK